VGAVVVGRAAAAWIQSRIHDGVTVRAAVVAAVVTALAILVGGGVEGIQVVELVSFASSIAPSLTSSLTSSLASLASLATSVVVTTPPPISRIITPAPRITLVLRIAWALATILLFSLPFVWALVVPCPVQAFSSVLVPRTSSVAFPAARPSRTVLSHSLSSTVALPLTVS
jgi:ABC-type multidrug transport system fused ATPase/permease subunit